MKKIAKGLRLAGWTECRRSPRIARAEVGKRQGERKKNEWSLTRLAGSPGNDEDGGVDLSESDAGRDASFEDGDDVSAPTLKNNSTLRKSLFSRRLSSRQTAPEGDMGRGRSGSLATNKVKEKAQIITEKASDWKHKLSKRITGSHTAAGVAGPMPSEEEVLLQYDAYIHSRGLEDQRSQLDVLSLEAKWNLVRDNMAESLDSKQRLKNKKDPVKLVQKLVADPTPSASEAVRQLVMSDVVATQLQRLLEANAVAALLATTTLIEGKPRKTAADNEVLADLLVSLRALLPYPVMLQGVLDGNGALVAVGCFDVSCDLAVRMAAVSLLRTLATAGAAAVQQVVAAFDAYSKTRLERARFEHVVALFESHSDMSVRLSISQLMMALLEGTTDRACRVAIRNDLIGWGFKHVLTELAETAPEEFRAKFAEQMDSFRRLQTADGGLASGTNRRGRSMSVGQTPADLVDGAGVVVTPAELVQKTAAELNSSSPKMMALLHSILENVMNGFGRSEASLWQWQCCDRLTRMLCSLSQLQVNANFDAEPTAATSPEMVLANLLLGAVARDEVFMLREELFVLRQDLAEVSHAAEVTITDLQAELEIARKAKARKRKVHKEKLALSGSTPATPATPDDGGAVMSSPHRSEVAKLAEAPATPEDAVKVPRRARHTLKKKKGGNSLSKEHKRKKSGSLSTMLASPAAAPAAPAAAAPAAALSVSSDVPDVISSDNETAPPSCAPPSTPEEATPPRTVTPVSDVVVAQAAAAVTTATVAAADEDSGDSDSD